MAVLCIALPSFAAAPNVATSAATSITTSSAALNGSGTPNNEAATGWFRISQTNPVTCDDVFGTRVPTIDGTDLGSGAVAIPYSITATGLTSGNTYYYCAIVQNNSGKAYGIIQSFQVPGPPVVTTNTQTLLTATSATLNGSVTPTGASTTGFFRWSSTSPGACNNSFGTVTTNNSLGSGYSSVGIAQPISGLSPVTTYYYCAIATNTHGTTLGSLLSFTTPPALPTVSTGSISLLTGTSVTISGSSNPGGATTTGWFRYSTVSPGSCNDSFGTRAPSSGGDDLGSGLSTVGFSEGISGLTQNTTYYYCAIAESSVGKVFGGVTSFTTPMPPVVVTTAITTVDFSNSSANLRGAATPNRAITTGWFRYSPTNPGTCDDSFGTRAPGSGGTDLGSGTSSVSFVQTINGLSPVTTYYYCAIAENSEGKVFGSVQSFLTEGPPVATTNAETLLTATSVTLQGAGTPNGIATTFWFRYSATDPGTCNNSFGTQVPNPAGNIGAAYTAFPYTYPLTGLTPNATYYYCSIANNAYGTSFGQIESFTTLVALPTPNTNSATLITGTTAQLNASANPGGGATTGWFRYATVSPGSCNDTFGTRAPSSGGDDLGSGNNGVAFSEGITGLAQNTTYYFCAIAENSAGKAFGSVSQFTTPIPPTAVTSAASNIGNTTARLNGNGVPNRATTLGWFRYSATNPVTCDDSFGTRAPVSSGTDLGAGTGAVGFLQNISGLSPSTMYYFCAITENSEGKAFGTVLSFLTLGPPVVTTNAQTLLTSTTATLNGAVNPNGAATTAWFRYATTDPVTCSNSFGSQVPGFAYNMGSGFASAGYTYALSSLTPNTTYYYCAIANNSYGTSFGTVVSFTTPATLPVVYSNSVSVMTGTTATLQGFSNPGGAATTAWFRYASVSPGTCNDTFGTRAPSSGGSDMGSGNNTTSYSQPITGLTQNTTYYFCAIAENSVGKTIESQNPSSFTTPMPPTAVTAAATNLGNTSATLNGSGVPNRAATTGWFRYSATNPVTCDDSFGSRAPASGGTNLGAGTSSANFLQNINSLSALTTYYYCAITENGEGKTFGSVLSFRTSGPPTVTTDAETSVTATTAQLNGTGNPNGSTTTAWFRYATVNPGTCSDAFGTQTTPSSSLANGTSNIPYGRGLSGLTPNTTYYYCAIANNVYGSVYGSMVSFTTPPALPTANTSSATLVTGTGAQLNATSSPGGATTTGWFRYSTVSPGTCNDTFGTRAPTSGGTNLGSGLSNVAYFESITGLTPNTTYYFCAITENSAGKTLGSMASFTTPIPPTVVTAAANSITNSSATLNGSGVPNRATTTGWFRYSSTHPGVCDDVFGTRAPVSSGTNLGSGTSSVGFNQSVTGLSAATTYYYCAIVENSEGKAFGSVLSFTTFGAPTVATNAETLLTATSVTLNGSVNPNGATSTGWFRYATTSPGTCNDTFGTRLPSSGTASLGSGTSSVAYAFSATGLTPVTTYYYCAIATNGYGTRFGSVVSFTTPAAPPTAAVAGVYPVTGTAATLHGQSIPGGAATTGWFRYATVSPGSCNDTFGTRAPSSGGDDLGSGLGTVDFEEAITGLTPNTTYYYCVIAESSAGKTLSPSVGSFTTPIPPTAVTAAVTSLTNTSVTLNGSGIPNRATTTGWFRYSSTDPGTCDDAFGSRAPVTGGTNLSSGTTSVNFSQSVSGLSPLTTYYYCAITENSEGKVFGSVMSFLTHATPTLMTNAATLVTATSTTLNGTGTPNGSSTTAWFRYSTVNPGSCHDGFGTATTPTSSLGSTFSSQAYSRSIASLTPNTTYYFCAIASNGYGYAFGSVLSFTTLAALPTANVVSNSPLSPTSIQINGSSNPGGAATTGWFRYSTTNPGSCNDSFGTRAPSSGGTNVGSGTSTVSFFEVLTGLTPNTTYYFCTIAENSVGKTFSTMSTFTTPRQPTVATLAATPITLASSTLNGQANPNGYTTTGWFRYSLTDPGTCNDSFGTRVPSSGGTSLGSGSSNVAYAQAVAGLDIATTYYFCAIASSSMGTSLGEVLSFTTPASLPAVTTVAASNVTTNAATLNGSGDPNGANTTGYFRYSSVNPGSCSDSFGTRVPASGGTALGNGNTGVPYSQDVTGLSAGVTYYYCAIGNNTHGTSMGAVLTFTPSPAPSVTTTAANPIASTSATLNASANPNGFATTGWFRYSSTNPGTCDDSFGTRAPVSSGSSLGAGGSSVPYSEAISGLTQNTTYYYCAIAENSVGKRFGAVLSFTTTAMPTVTTDAVTVITGTTVTLNGSANPNRDAATGWFRYDTVDPGSCNDSFGTRAPSSGGTSLGAGSTSAPYSQLITGLTAGTTYYYCAIASNTVGTSFGTVGSFATLAAPSVVSQAATSVLTTTATLNGSANPNSTSATGWFRYSTVDPVTCNNSFGTLTSNTALGAGASGVAYTANLSSLSPGTTYYYCAIAQNTVGTSFGAVLSFTALLTPSVTTQAATSVSTTTATINASGNPNGVSTAGWFRYATSDPGGCSDGFGTRVPVAGGTDLGSGSSGVPYQQALTGLTAGTTYYYCALASSVAGSAVGSVLSFTTTAPPQVTTGAASSIAGTTVTLNATANPKLLSTTGWFRYSTSDPGTCNDSFGTRAPASSGSDLGSGSSAAPYSQGLTGLSVGTTYYYCAIAENTAGKTFGAVSSFSTLQAPSVTTAAANAITHAAATLNGSANPNGSTTTGWFRYDTSDPGTCNDSFGTRAPSSGGSALGSSSSVQNYNQGISGLSASTTYYFCAIASSGVGTRFGAVSSFTTGAAPTVTTDAATAITGSAATLNGNANPNLLAATGWFRYSAVNPVTCNDSFGTRAPSSGGTSLGAGVASVVFEQTLAGLTPGATYYYCAIAENTAGKTFGSVLSFTTIPPPTVTTSAATSVATTGATVNGTANPNGANSIGWFRYSTTNPVTCSDSFGTRAPGAGGSSLGMGLSGVGYSQALTGLLPDTTYYFCAIAQSSSGTAFGSVLSFTTLVGPAVTTSAASSVTPVGATLNGSADPNGFDATGWFRYSTVNPGSCTDSFGVRAPAAGGTALGSGSSPVNYSEGLTGLAPSTTYYYCAIASTSVGPGFGAVQSFTTGNPPVATTYDASAITMTTATLHGEGDPNGSAATGWFRYSSTDPGLCNDSFGTRAPSSSGTSLGSGTANVAYSEPITGLTPGTTYFYCAIVSSVGGTVFGEIVPFTARSVPAPTTLAATSVTAVTATLQATSTTGIDAAAGWFRYSTSDPGTCDDSFGTRAPASGGTALGFGASAIPFSRAIAGLSPETTYYYCAIASNSFGTGFGSVLSFTTSSLGDPPTVTSEDATSVTDTSVTLNGTVDPGDSDAVAWFRYDTTEPTDCDDLFGTRVPENDGEGTDVAASETSPADVSEDVTDLQPGTTYYYCAIAENQGGVSYGEVLSLTTSAVPVLPVVVTVEASGVATTSLTLNGTVDPSGSDATAWFRYDTTEPASCDDSFGTRIPATGGTAVDATEADPVAISEDVTGLSPGTTYYYCIIAENADGVSFGEVFGIVTAGLAAPTVSTLAATDAMDGEVTLNATADPNGIATTAWFRYDTVDPGDCNDTFGTQVPAGGSFALGDGIEPVAFAEMLTGLAPQTYYFCGIAENTLGKSFGEVMSFSLTVPPPTVTTLPALNITGESATLSGSANPNGSVTRGWFRYGTMDPGVCDDSFGTAIPADSNLPLGEDSDEVEFHDNPSGLQPATTYYYCAAAANAGSAVFGEVLSFTTLEQEPGMPTSDAGVPDDGTAGAAGAAGSAGAAGAVAPGESGGCGCRVQGNTRTSPLAFGVLLVALAVLWRRRRACVDGANTPS